MATLPFSLSSNTSGFIPNSEKYIGRFAPSPSGELHFGSLIGALASYCDARFHQGKWLVRMEDLDPPREQPGAAEAILKSLEAHGFAWDGEVLYQSNRHEAYQAALENLQQNSFLYPCYCNRKVLQLEGTTYQRHCINLSTTQNQPFALRIKTPGADPRIPLPNNIAVDDVFLGMQHFALEAEVGDFIIKRKDGLFAYQLAVVVDDDFQGITHVIRGSDLLSSTPMQIHLQHCLQLKSPQYGHAPVATNHLGQKLSKQNHSPAIKETTVSSNLYKALLFLHQTPPTELLDYPPAEILTWAVQNWNRQSLPNILAIEIDDQFDARISHDASGN